MRTGNSPRSAHETSYHWCGSALARLWLYRQPQRKFYASMAHNNRKPREKNSRVQSLPLAPDLSVQRPWIDYISEGRTHTRPSAIQVIHPEPESVIHSSSASDVGP